MGMLTTTVTEAGAVDEASIRVAGAKLEAYAAMLLIPS